jgi:hypothetical protein
MAAPRPQAAANYCDARADKGRSYGSGAGVTYTSRQRTFVAWSAVLGYAFDFYDLIIMAFLLGPMFTCPLPGARGFSILERGTP